MLPQEELAEVGWMWPAYMSRGSVDSLIDDIERAPAGQKRAVLEAALPQFYSPEYLAAMMTERYSRVPVVRDFQVLIAEGIEAGMLGLYAAAVSTLVPVVEGILRGIGGTENRDVDTGRAALSKEIGQMIAYEIKNGYDDQTTGERVAMLQGFKTFFDNHLFVNTEDFAGAGELNRHGILHALFKQFGERANFCILMSIIDQMTFFMTLRTSGISALAPDDTSASRRLSAYYLLLLSVASRRSPTQGK